MYLYIHPEFIPAVFRFEASSTPRCTGVQSSLMVQANASLASCLCTGEKPGRRAGRHPPFTASS